MNLNIKYIIITFLLVMLLACRKVDFIEQPKKIYIYTVKAYPTESESVTLKNNTDMTIDISGWSIGDKDNQFAFTIPDSTYFHKTRFITYLGAELGFSIDDRGETLYLKDRNENIIDTWKN